MARELSVPEGYTAVCIPNVGEITPTWHWSVTPGESGFECRTCGGTTHVIEYSLGNCNFQRYSITLHGCRCATCPQPKLAEGDGSFDPENAD